MNGDGERDIVACGLEIVSREIPRQVPTVLDAIRVVASVNTRPTATVTDSDPDAVGVLDELWRSNSSSTALRSDPDGFLFALPGAGASEKGWAHVRDPHGDRLPSRVHEVMGAPEFIAMAAGGEFLCAVSTEDDDYWLVVHEFTS